MLAKEGAFLGHSHGFVEPDEVPSGLTIVKT